LVVTSGVWLLVGTASALTNQTSLSITSRSGSYGTPLTLATTGGSGTGTVSYLAVNGTAQGCFVESGVLSVTQAGTCLVTATKASDSKYNSKASSQTTINFARADQTAISLTSTTGTFGATLLLNTAGGSGVGVVTFQVSNGTAQNCSEQAGVLNVTQAGTCLVTATRAADNNYNSRSSSRTTVTFERADQVALSISSTTGTYGTPLTLTTSGGNGLGTVTFQVQNGTAQNCSEQAGLLSVTRPLRVTEVGTCLVIATKAADANYRTAASSTTTITFSTSAFANQDFASADFTNAVLTNADFTNSNLSRAILTGTNLTNANLAGAILSGVRSGSITGTPAALPSGWKLSKGFLVGPGANLSGANLAGATLAYANLTGTDLSHANLTSANLRLVRLSRANLTGANLTGANVGGADIRGASLSGVRTGSLIGTPSWLPSGWKLLSGYLVGSGANLRNANLSGVYFGNDVDASDADFSGANLTGAIFGPTTLISGANLTGANLSQARINGTDLSWVTLTGANLSDTDLSRYDYGQGFFSETKIAAVVSGSITGVPAPLPFGWKLVGGYLIGPNVNLAGANLTGLDLTGTNLGGAILSDANLTRTKLASVTLGGIVSGGVSGTPTSLPGGWRIDNGFLIGASADLSGASLPLINLSGTNLTLSDFSGAVLTASNLSGANLSMTNLSGANLVGANLSNADLTNADLTGANLTGADLTGAKLIIDSGHFGYGTILRRANLTQAKLAGATLTGLMSGSITGTPASLPTGWSLAGGYLIGPSANLEGANLSGLDLTGLDLTGVYLSRAILKGVNLTRTKLDGATISGVLSGGIIGTPASLPAGWSIVNGVFVRG